MKQALKEILCWHNWSCISVQHVVKSYDHYEHDEQSTHATMMCRKCAKIKVRYHIGAGHLTVSQMNGYPT